MNLIRICGGITICVEPLLVLGPTTETALNMPLQPAGEAVTVVLTDPPPLLLEKPRVALHELLRLLCIPQENAGVKLVAKPLTVVVMVLFVSPVETFRELGDWLTMYDRTEAVPIV